MTLALTPCSLLGVAKQCPANGITQLTVTKLVYRASQQKKRLLHSCFAFEFILWLRLGQPMCVSTGCAPLGKTFGPLGLWAFGQLFQLSCASLLRCFAGSDGV